MAEKSSSNGAELDFEQTLWAAADKLRGHLDAAEMVSELIGLAKDMRDAVKRGEVMGLSDEELAFYDALAQNRSAIEVAGQKELAVIATELVRHVRRNATIDWTVKQFAQAKMRALVERILRQYGYRPDLQEAATQTVRAGGAAYRRMGDGGVNWLSVSD